MPSPPSNSIAPSTSGSDGSASPRPAKASTVPAPSALTQAMRRAATRPAADRRTRSARHREVAERPGGRHDRGRTGGQTGEHAREHGIGTARDHCRRVQLGQPDGGLDPLGPTGIGPYTGEQPSRVSWVGQIDRREVDPHPRRERRQPIGDGRIATRHVTSDPHGRLGRTGGAETAVIEPETIAEEIDAGARPDIHEAVGTRESFCHPGERGPRYALRPQSFVCTRRVSSSARRFARSVRHRSRNSGPGSASDRPP